MTNKQTLDKTRAYVRKTMEGEGSGHDWWHIVRVVNNALGIAKKEGGDLFVIELGALLHDIADWKFHNGDSSVGPRVTREWLQTLQVPEETISQVAYIVEYISFKGGTNMHKMKTLEGKIVQDADRLDALGAIGIARVFAYGGAHPRPIYNPELKPLETFESFEAYQQAMRQSSSLNHFYEKLLKLKDFMNTKTAKGIATQRHTFMEAYLEQFYAEWNGKK
jgi:uncharacterized protein